MNIKNIKTLLSTFVIVVFLATGCNKDFLEIDPEQSVSIDGAVTSVNSMRTALNGVYSTFQDADYYGRTLPLVPELMADNVYVSFQNAGRYLDYDAFIVRNTDGSANSTWTDIYLLIANANVIIERGSSIEFSASEQATANQLIGEARAARALAYFDLVRLFAQPYNTTAGASHLGVPVVTSVGEIVAPDRATVSEVYTQIIADLQQSIALMSIDHQDGRFSINAAKAILSKVYLYMENWSEAENLASEVIASGDYSLISNANYATEIVQDLNSESIFEIINRQDDGAGINTVAYFMHQSGYGDGLITQSYYDALDADDIRRSLITVGSRTGGENPALIANLMYPNGGSTQEDNQTVIRLSEIYLIRAEARAEQGNNNGAQSDLDQIRQRANPAAIASSATGAALVDLIIEERRLELLLEGNRLFDLNRKRMNVDIVRSEGEIINTTYPNEKYILPIPQNEINANPNVTQNPGYGG